MNIDYAKHMEAAKHERATAISAMTLALINKVEKVFRCITTKIKNNHAYKELNALSDATLKDIGVSRSEIRYLSNKKCA